MTAKRRLSIRLGIQQVGDKAISVLQVCNDVVSKSQIAQQSFAFRSASLARKHFCYE